MALGLSRGPEILGMLLFSASSLCLRASCHVMAVTQGLVITLGVFPQKEGEEFYLLRSGLIRFRARPTLTYSQISVG